MSAKYVRCIDNTPHGWVTLKYAGGVESQALRLGGRYLATDAVVKQHPQRFEPLEPAKAPEAA
jgi:hypothetical protein